MKRHPQHTHPWGPSQAPNPNLSQSQIKFPRQADSSLSPGIYLSPESVVWLTMVTACVVRVVTPLSQQPCSCPAGLNLPEERQPAVGQPRCFSTQLLLALW